MELIFYKMTFVCRAIFLQKKNSLKLEIIRVIKEDEYVHLNAFTNMLNKLL